MGRRGGGYNRVGGRGVDDSPGNARARRDVDVWAWIAAPVSAASADQSCRIATAEAFSRVAGANLRCATSEPFMSGAVEQKFEHGRMLWLEEWVTITVMQAGGSYEGFDDLFYPGDPESGGLTPPSANLIEPHQGFGEVWRKIGGTSSDAHRTQRVAHLDAQRRATERSAAVVGGHGRASHRRGRAVGDPMHPGERGRRRLGSDGSPSQKGMAVV